MQVTPSSVRSAIRTGGSPPCRAMPWFHACRRALCTAAATCRLLRAPPAAVSRSARHAVGTDATGPNSSPLVAHHPEIADHPGAVRNRARQVGKDPSPVIAAQPRGQRR
jgi:hypothetical protein